MEILTVEFVYKCQACGGLEFYGPYYFTTDSPLFDNIQNAIQMVIDGYLKKIRFDGGCEICDLTGEYPNFIFSSLMQSPDSYDDNEIFKYSWHNCEINSLNPMYQDVMGISVLSGFRITTGNPKNDDFLGHLIKLSKKCNSMSELVGLLMKERD